MSRKPNPQKPDRRVSLRYWRLGLLGSLACLYACAPVGPDFVRPEVPVNPEWLDAELEQFETDAAELANWWRTLEDPVLDELIATARIENNNIRIAGLRVIESQARLNIALGNRWPQQQVLAGDATAIGVSEDSAGGATIDTSYTEFNVGASVVWEIDFWGRYRLSVDSAEASLDASVADYDGVMITLLADVAQNYLLIRTFERRLFVADYNIDLQEESLRITRAKFDAGAVSALDVDQAETLLLNLMRGSGPGGLAEAA